MAIGDREFRIKKFCIDQNDSVHITVEHRIVPKSEDASDWQTAYLAVPWATFWAALTAGEKTALGSAKTKAIALAKALYAPTANATEVA